MNRIRVVSLSLIAFVASASALAGDIQFSAEVDSNRVGIDDSVALKLTVVLKNNSQVEEPEFEAPDFQLAAQYSSLSVSSSYDSTAGGFTSVNTQQLTKVLRPMKLGVLKISKIQLNAGGKILRAPDISIQVTKVGPGASNSQGNTQGNSAGNSQMNPNPSFRFGFNPGLGPSQPQQPKKSNVSGTKAFLRAETDKSTYFKGEQIVVSYYLYHQMRIFNLQVEKFPVLTGFLREDLDVPVMGQRLTSDVVVLSGVQYERSLLAQYAAYPLEEGKRDIDSISLKYNYYTNSGRNGLDEDDPFFGFFQPMVPRVWSGQSDPLSVQVLPLPDAGRPKNFTGGVGDFTISSAVDKYDVHAGEAVTLTVKVEGQGSASSIQAPKAIWPSEIELFDSKGKTQPSKKGIGGKVFEYLLIPHNPGKLILPSLEFGFYDPNKKQYYSKSTEPVELSVLAPLPGSTATSGNRTQSQGQSVARSSPQESNDATAPQLKGLKNGPSATNNRPRGQSLWKLLWSAGGLAFIVLCALIFWDAIKRRKSESPLARQQQGKNWERLKGSAKNASQGASWKEVKQAYELLNEELLQALEERFTIGARSFSRGQLEELIVGDKGLAKPVWDRMVRVLEYCDTVRFANSSGEGSESAARSELTQWVSEGQSLVRILGRV